MAGGDFILRASGIYTPAIIGLSAAPWRFLPCSVCCLSGCDSCQSGTTQEAYGVTLAGFTSVIFDYCGATLNDSFVLQQTTTCGWSYTFPGGIGDWSNATIVLEVGSRVRLTVRQFGGPDVAIYWTDTAADWDCDFSGFDVPWISGWACGNASTCTVDPA